MNARYLCLISAAGLLIIFQDARTYAVQYPSSYWSLRDRVMPIEDAMKDKFPDWDDVKELERRAGAERETIEIYEAMLRTLDEYSVDSPQERDRLSKLISGRKETVDAMEKRLAQLKDYYEKHGSYPTHICIKLRNIVLEKPTLPADIQHRDTYAALCVAKLHGGSKPWEKQAFARLKAYDPLLITYTHKQTPPPLNVIFDALAGTPAALPAQETPKLPIEPIITGIPNLGRTVNIAPGGSIKPNPAGQSDSYLWVFVLWPVPPAFPLLNPLVAVFLNLWLWLIALRMLWCATGRFFGFYNPNHFRYWLLVPWRFLYLRVWLPFSWWWEERFHFGDAATARPAGFIETAANVYKRGSIFLGRYRPLGIGAFQPVGIDGNKHLVMVAGTGGGKTTQLLTMLGLHDGPAFIIDPKGQMAKVISRRMGEGGNGIFGQGKKICVLDPSNMVEGVESARWNPFDEISRAKLRATKAGRDPDDAVVEFAQKMVDGLILKNAKTDPFWTGAAKDFLLGLVLFVYKREPSERRTLSRLYDLLTVGLPECVAGSESGFDALLYEMSQEDAFGGAVSSSASGVLDGSSTTTGSVLFTIREQLQWLKRPALRAISSDSSFHLEELHDSDLALFVCAKLSDIRQDFPGWFRLLTVLTVAVFEEIKTPLKKPCLMAIDEFANLGKLEAVEVSAPYMRSFGVRLLCIVQNIGQLKDAGYENYESFIGNAECCWWLATNHKDNLEYLEKRLGRRTTKEKLDGPPWWWPFSRRSARHGLKDREVMTADQISRFLARGNLIVTRAQRAFLLKPEPYFKALPVCFYEPDSDYRETAPRQLMRGLFEQFVKEGKPSQVKSRPTRAPARQRAEEERLSELAESFSVRRNGAAEREPPSPPRVAPTRAHDANGASALRARENPPEREEPPQEAPPPPAAAQVVELRPLAPAISARGPELNFLRLFTECFSETNGTYAHPKTRRDIWSGFSPLLLEGKDFYATQMDFEEWVAKNLPRQRADHVIMFLDERIEKLGKESSG